MVDNTLAEKIRTDIKYFHFHGIDLTETDLIDTLTDYRTCKEEYGVHITYSDYKETVTKVLRRFGYDIEW